MPRTTRPTSPVTTAAKRQDSPEDKNNVPVATDDKQQDKSSGGYIFMRVLHPDYLTDPHPLDFADGMDSREFALEKTSRMIVKPLGFASEKEWIGFATEAWDWYEAEELRRKQQAIRDFLNSEIEGDAAMIDFLRDQLEAIAT